MKKILIALVVYFPLALFSQSKSNEPSDRYKIGWENLSKIDGDAGVKVIQGLENTSSELSKYIIEHVFGVVYNEKNLSNKDKEIVALCSLIAQRAIPEMKVHINGALNTGNTINEIKDVILQMSIYTGFPKSITAMKTLQEVLEVRKVKGHIDSIGEQPKNFSKQSRLERGSSELTYLDPRQEERLYDNLGDFAPELARITMEHAFGDIYANSTLNRKTRQIATIAALTTLGNTPSQLKFHLNAGIHLGLSIPEINEIMLLISVYAGFPAALNGTNILKEVVEQQQKNIL